MDKDFDAKLIDLLGWRTWFDKRPYKLEDNEFIIHDPNDIRMGFKGKINIISAPFFSGKSYMTSQLDSPKDWERGICIVHPRRDPLKQYMADSSHIDWTYYEKSEGKPKQAKELREAKNLAICNLSLHRLTGSEKVKGYKHLIFDEWELNRTSSIGTKAVNTIDSERAQSELIKNSETIWVLGWIFTDESFEYLKGFDKEINFIKFDKQIAKDIEINRYADRKTLLNKLAQRLNNKERVLLFSELSNSIPNVLENEFLEMVEDPNIKWDYFNRDKRPSLEDTKTWCDLEKKHENQFNAFSPIVSHGYNFRNEEAITGLLIDNGSKSLPASDVAQFMWRNREQKEIDLFITKDKDEKKISYFEEIAINPPHLNQDQIKLFGSWDDSLGHYREDRNNKLFKNYKRTTLNATIERTFREGVLFLQLGWLGLKEANINHVEETYSGVVSTLSIEEIVELGEYVEGSEYYSANRIDAKYTRICEDLEVEELTLSQALYWDNGNFKGNKINRLRMHDNFVVKDNRIKQKGAYAYEYQWNIYQSMVKTFIELERGELLIPNVEFKESALWRKIRANEKEFNEIMRQSFHDNLCIRTDDKAKPLNWLKRYLTAHNYHCEIDKPSKERKTELSQLAEASVKKEYAEWRTLEKEKYEDPKRSSYRGLRNIRITHYLEWLLLNERHSELTKEMKDLRNIFDEWNITIKDYELDKAL